MQRTGHFYLVLTCRPLCAAPCPIPESLRSPIYEVDKAAVKTNSRLDKFSAWGRRGGPRETLVAGVRAHPGRGHAETAPQAGLSARSEEISPVGRALLHGQFARRILGRPKHLPVLRSKSNKDVLRGEPSEYSNPGLGSVQRISQTSSGGGFSRIM